MSYVVSRAPVIVASPFGGLCTSWRLALQWLVFNLPPGWDVELTPTSAGEGEFQEWDEAMAKWLYERRTA